MEIFCMSRPHETFWLTSVGKAQVAMTFLIPWKWVTSLMLLFYFIKRCSHLSHSRKHWTLKANFLCNVVVTTSFNWLVFSTVAQVRLRCQKGIPPALRGRAWLYLSGGKVKKEQNKGKFQVSEASCWLPLLGDMMYFQCSLSLPSTAETVSTSLWWLPFFFFPCFGSQLFVVAATTTTCTTDRDLGFIAISRIFFFHVQLWFVDPFLNLFCIQYFTEHQPSLSTVVYMVFTVTASV